MAFEITATINNFGGKLLKLAHKVKTKKPSIRSKTGREAPQRPPGARRKRSSTNRTPIGFL